MLTPEQVADTRKRIPKFSYHARRCVLELLADRTEIAQELERVRHNTATLWPWSVTLEAITNLAEKLK